MKKYFRRITAVIILAPGIFWTYFLSIFIGKEKAIKLCGPFFTLASLPFSRSWVPKVESAADFDNFSAKMQKKFWLWKPFFDFSIVKDNSELFELRITYCPICDVIQSFGLYDLAPFVCEADWQIAKENKGKWIFKRVHQLSNGDLYCDHTYLRKT